MTNRSKRRQPTGKPINFWNGFVFKFSTKFIIGLIIVLVFLTLAQCTIETPEAPSWDTQFTVPVINRTYDMEELISKVDQEDLGIDTNDFVYFSLSEDLDPQGLDPADFSTSDLSHTVAEQLGTISIGAPNVDPATINLGSIANLALALPGDSAVVSPMSFEIFNNLPTITDFTQIVIDSAQMLAIVDNNLGVDIDSVEIRLHDRVIGRDVLVDTFATVIYDGTIDTLATIFTSDTMSNSLRMDVFAFTPGGTVQQFSTKYLGTEISFPSDISITQATAVIPEQEDRIYNYKSGVDLDPGESITSATLESGQLTVDLNNGSAISAVFSLQSNDIQNNGSPLIVNRNVSANSIDHFTIDLSGYDFIPTDDSISIDIVVSIPSSGSQTITIDASDYLNVQSTITDLTFSSVTGSFTTKNVNFDEVTQSLDIPDGFDNVGLVSSIVTLEIENGIDLPGNLACTLVANNGQHLYVNDIIQASGGLDTRVTTITIDDVGDFLSPIPDTVVVTGAISYGDGLEHTLNYNDSVFAKVNIYAPLNVVVNDMEVSDLDIEKEEISQEDIDLITDQVLDARFVYTVTNHLPLGVRAIISFSPDSLSLYSSPELVLDTILVDGAPTDLVTGIVNADSITTGEIYIDSVDVQILRNDTLYIRPQLFLNGSDPTGVQLTGSDYITISGYIQVNYRFDGDL